MEVSATCDLVDGYESPGLSRFVQGAPSLEALLGAGRFLDALAAALWLGTQVTLNYRLSGTDTLTWGDQSCWIEIKGIRDFLSRVAGDSPMRAIGNYPAQYGILLDAVERQRFQGPPSFRDYMRQVEAWARAYDEQAVLRSSEEFQALYDDAFFEAMDLQEELP